MAAELSDRPLIALTMGDPCGVGPEVLVRALADPGVTHACRPLVMGDLSALRRAARLLGAPLAFRPVTDVSEIASQEKAIPVFRPSRLDESQIPYGRPSAQACRATIDYIETAAHLALQGQVGAVVTGPINKEALHRNGFSFPGHTEFLQHLCGASRVVMMLAGPRLRVALVTIHCALRQVPERLMAPSLEETIRISLEALQRDFGIRRPRLAVAGLNPHAGEAGRFGTEDKDIIEPVVRSVDRLCRPCRVLGPYPPDTVFTRAYQGEFHAVVAMYHDQGLIPVKLVHFDEAVNVTLGLPIVRTSVDHGTAYDIAGQGKARPSSLLHAIRAAVSMARSRALWKREDGTPC
ncbi:4-hydroxythreonine-4-phosphate dehydrogenase [Desulfacinum hydrothermale DSM 13146]|uniref:4-hydroxythreonine-4-phosphate dehydrogenase n=1 Tax=Desulfacinum hydrothermale DSM 13146 TaxID=1121390 RepID=A0A1W1XKZ2_9BACT|nr:4-hydroxythreonine-4-phosphate dehydrogenase PdxA [Desulfacinum hydrothermale]SMC24502.1 4-hydroxythreonine-4-phosphate dehydrogenase [Desulfacinum hydrothermale DSM 13146]